MSDGRVVELIRYEVPVRFDSRLHHWCLVTKPLNAPTRLQALWWEPSTKVVWILDFGE